MKMIAMLALAAMVALCAGAETAPSDAQASGTGTPAAASAPKPATATDTATDKADEPKSKDKKGAEKADNKDNKDKAEKTKKAEKPDKGGKKAAAGKAKAYPLDTCIVSDNELGSMGDPVTIVHEGQEVKFCCKPCEAKFNKDPARYLSKLPKS